MNLQTSVTVTRARLENLAYRRQLVHEARMRLTDLGLATLEQLTDEPSMTTSAPSVIVDEPMPSDPSPSLGNSTTS
jgi:hypothetical protein